MDNSWFQISDSAREVIQNEDCRISYGKVVFLDEPPLLKTQRFRSPLWPWIACIISAILLADLVAGMSSAFRTGSMNALGFLCLAAFVVIVTCLAVAFATKGRPRHSEEAHKLNWHQNITEERP